MTKQMILPCDFSTDKERGFFWHRDHNAVGSATLHYDGLLEFQGSRHRVFIENIGTPEERVIVNDISDLNDE